MGASLNVQFKRDIMYHCPFCGKSHDSQFMVDLCESLDIKNAEIDNIIYSFAGCTTNAEVNELVNTHLSFLNANPGYFKFARNARKRIAQLRRINNQLTEIIYKN